MARRSSMLVAAAAGSTVCAWIALAHGAPQDAKQDAESARRAGVIARFEGGQITLAELEDVIRSRTLRDRVPIAAEGGRKHLLDELVRYDLLVAEAGRRGYREHALVTEAVKRAAIERLVAHDYRVSPSAVPDADVAQAYEAQRAERSRPSWRRASQIELPSADEARHLIEELKGADRLRFAEVARARSRDPRTARQGGELGYFDSAGKRDHAEDVGAAKEVVAAAFALEPVGAITSEPVAHDGVFSIVMFTGQMAPFAKPLTKLAPAIRERLASQRSTQAIEARVAALRVEQKPEVHPELLSAIVLDAARSKDMPEGFPAAPPDPRAPPRLMQPDGY